MKSQKDLSQADLSKLRDEDMSAAERAELQRRFDKFIEVMRGKAGKGTAPAKKVGKRMPAKAAQNRAPIRNSAATTGAAGRVLKWRPTEKRR